MRIKYLLILLIFLLLGCQSHYVSDLEYKWSSEYNGWLVSKSLSDEKNIIIPERIINLNTKKRDKVIGIDKDAFANSKIESITFPKDLFYIGERAFENSNLKGNLSLENITIMKERAFNNTKVDEFFIPDTLVEAGFHSIIPVDDNIDNFKVIINIEEIENQIIPKDKTKYKYNKDWTLLKYKDKIYFQNSFNLDGSIINEALKDKSVLDEKTTTFDIIKNIEKNNITFTLGSTISWAKIVNNQLIINNDEYSNSAALNQELPIIIRATNNDTLVSKNKEFIIRRPSLESIVVDDIIYDKIKFEYPETILNIKEIKPAYSIFDISDKTILSSDESIASIRKDGNNNIIEPKKAGQVSFKVVKDAKDITSLNVNIKKYPAKDLDDLKEIVKNVVIVKDATFSLNEIDTKDITTFNQLFASSTYNGDISTWDTSNVTSLYGTFFNSEFTRDLNTWDTSNVVNMNHTFRNAEKFNGNIQNWNTKKVTTMKGMFVDAVAFNQDLLTNNDSWNVEKVESMELMFAQSNKKMSFNSDISNWNLLSLKTTKDMFYQNSTYDREFTNWNTPVLENMDSMFERSYYNKPITFNTSNVKSMNSTFSYTFYFNADISNLDTSSVISMNRIFQGAQKFQQDISNWNLENLQSAIDAFNSIGTKMNIMIAYQPVKMRESYPVSTKSELINELFSYKGKPGFDLGDNGDYNYIDVSEVTDMSDLFKDKTTFNGDITKWNTAKVTNMNNMFENAAAFDKDISKWVIGSATTHVDIFKGASLDPSKRPKF